MSKEIEKKLDELLGESEINEQGGQTFYAITYFSDRGGGRKKKTKITAPDIERAAILASDVYNLFKKNSKRVWDKEEEELYTGEDVHQIVMEKDGLSVESGAIGWDDGEVCVAVGTTQEAAERVYNKVFMHPNEEDEGEW